MEYIFFYSLNFIFPHKKNDSIFEKLFLNTKFFVLNGVSGGVDDDGGGSASSSE